MSGVTVLAAEAGGGTTNFLIPNGTFFFILAIFLIVFAVIAKFVVIPVQHVLSERERQLTQTSQDNRQAAEQDAATDRDYRQELAEARSEAGGLRDQARAEGRQLIDDKRAQANEEVADKLRQASEVLADQADSLSSGLNASVDSLSATLANRILGVDGSTANRGGR
jgi:F-type H+-transporting ATPase subunit b